MTWMKVASSPPSTLSHPSMSPSPLSEQKHPNILTLDVQTAQQFI
jgi:hypothetical protein